MLASVSPWPPITKRVRPSVGSNFWEYSPSKSVGTEPSACGRHLRHSNSYSPGFPANASA